MERGRTKLVEEGNTIYEIDLDCMRRRKLGQEQENHEKKQGEKKNKDFSEN